MVKAWGERENLTLSRAELDNCRPTGAGRVLRAFCPFHGSDKQRSLRVNLDTGHFKCFACDAWGYLDSARHSRRAGDKPIYGASYAHARAPSRTPKPPKPEPDARPELAELMAQYRAALPGSPGEAYLLERRIPLDVAQAAGVGYSPPGQWAHRNAAGRPVRDWHRGRLVFPHTTPAGDIVNLYGRAVGDAPKGERHDHLAGAKGYFHAQALRDGSGPVTVCEGAFDALALMAAGAPRVVAVFGVTGWRWGWAKDVRELLFALDTDETGSEKLRELAREAAHRGRRVAYLEPGAYGSEKDAAAAWAAGVLDVGELAGIFDAQTRQNRPETPERPAMMENPLREEPPAPGANDEPGGRCLCGFALKSGQSEASRAERILRTLPATILDEMRLQRGAWLELETRKHNPTLADALWGASIADNPMETGKPHGSPKTDAPESPRSDDRALA